MSRLRIRCANTRTCIHKYISRETFAHDVKSTKHPTAVQRAEIEDRRTTIYRKVQKFRGLQQLFMPNLRSALKLDENEFKGRWSDAEKIILYLPSTLPDDIRVRVTTTDTVDTELALREAEAFDALDGLRNRLRSRTFMNAYKIKNITGQNPNTKARELQARVDARVHLLKVRYRRARQCVRNLVGEARWYAETWSERMKELKEEDVRGVSEKAMNEAERQSYNFALQQANIRPTLATNRTLKEKPDGTHTISWIWTSANVLDEKSDPGLQTGMYGPSFMLSSFFPHQPYPQALQVEWAKARARAERWEEEVQLVYEEMRRTIVYCRWKANWWRERATPGVRSAVSAELQDGMAGYSGEHAALEDAMGDTLEKKWGKVRRRAEELISTNFATRDTALSNEAPEEIVVDLRSGEEDEWDDE